ncbi:G-protein beta WD-40 repeats containing protein [Reticulomyxa filosa]|uniref:G-protein beta WD-40 repeats containing protein n=1 Tax=Reticulomyxa filosa TaxID=46433 RepID=X6MB44_RETFI|nr:G-protein beta WD-40 repeats containing protein [Reticulomyxa filosa]|eukprot:ETO10255.1 G-protein beta WD-40 repeats containing protein [Reticulomyxa filosa]
MNEDITTDLLENKKLDDLASPFETLHSLPTPLSQSQCIIHNNEILILGGWNKKACYSYHIIKDQYKYICSYPDDINLYGHCVVKYLDNNNPNNIILLSISGSKYIKKQTLIMNYISIWNNNNNKIKKDIYNEWIPLIDNNNNNNNKIIIGRDEDNYEGARAIINGSNKHLLFITYPPKNISIFNLNTFKYIKHDILPIDNDNGIRYHCFITKTENELPLINEMILLRKNKGLLIKYEEDNNIFQFNIIDICTTIEKFFSYGYVCVNDFILFFGGCSNPIIGISKDIHKFSMKENKWLKIKQNLPISLSGSVIIFNKDNMYIHIIGGHNGKEPVSKHMRIKINQLIKEENEIEKQWIKEEEERKEIEEIKKIIEKKKDKFNLKKLKKQIEIEMIIEYWLRSSFINMGWLNYFNIIIARYVKIKFFKILKILQGHSINVNSVKFSLDGTKIISCSDDSTIRIWDVKSGKELHVLKRHSGPTYHIHFSPKDNIAITCSYDELIRLWDIRSWTEIKKLEGHLDSVTKAQFSPDGEIIASSSLDNTIRIWNVKSGQQIKRLQGHSNWVNDVQFSPDGQQLVSSSNDNTICIWDVNSGENIHKLKGHSEYVIMSQFSPDGKYIVSCSHDETIRIWDVKSGNQIEKLVLHFDVIKDVKFSIDGQTIISCSSDKTIRLWDTKLKIEMQKLEGHSKGVTGIDISPDDSMIASSSKDGTIRLWGLL